jgi:hypothetical protein
MSDLDIIDLLDDNDDDDDSDGASDDESDRNEESPRRRVRHHAVGGGHASRVGGRRRRSAQDDNNNNNNGGSSKQFRSPDVIRDKARDRRQAAFELGAARYAAHKKKLAAQQRAQLQPGVSKLQKLLRTHVRFIEEGAMTEALAGVAADYMEANLDLKTKVCVLLATVLEQTRPQKNHHRVTNNWRLMKDAFEALQCR